jgi:hypothetical protein
VGFALLADSWFCKSDVSFLELALLKELADYIGNILEMV